MENFVTTEQMESLKALSDVNIKVSEAQNLLEKLQKEEADYLISREKKAIEKIEAVVVQSQDLVKQADKNYSEIEKLRAQTTDLVAKLLKFQEDFTQAKDEFDSRNKAWEEDFDRKQLELVENLRKLNLQAIQIENDKKSLTLAQKQLANDQHRLETDRGEVERSIIRLKENRI